MHGSAAKDNLFGGGVSSACGLDTSVGERCCGSAIGGLPSERRCGSAIGGLPSERRVSSRVVAEQQAPMMKKGPGDGFTLSMRAQVKAKDRFFHYFLPKR